jgi:acyl-CoA synthetase (AMP-forming)/AMP-acid ligase II
MYQAMLLRPAVALPGTLRLARSSSSPLSPRTWTLVQERLGCTVVNSYGMTEAAHQMASTPISGDSTFLGTVGRAAGPEIGVATAAGVSTRGAGELVIRGAGVMAHYLSPAGANEDAFVDGWFRTGDTGTIDDRDVVRLLGRLKELINVGGEKVSPFEVDDVLLAHPAVAEAVAFAAPSELLGEVVHAAVVLRSDLDEATLRRYAREQLAKCKVPTRIHFVTEIPKGPTGKVQRIHLAAQLGLSGQHDHLTFRA